MSITPIPMNRGFRPFPILRPSYAIGVGQCLAECSLLQAGQHQATSTSFEMGA